MEPHIPDFTRIEAVLNHTEPDRVPLAEAAIGYAIMSQFLGRPVTDEDVAAQVEFWARAGYDYALFTVGMMRPGGVTQDSQVSKIMSQTLAREDSDPEAWNLWKKPLCWLLTSSGGSSTKSPNRSCGEARSIRALP